MDHPMIGAERFAAARRAAYVPPISVGGATVKDRLDRHFAALVPDAADEATRLGVAQTTQLLREITPRPAAAPTHRTQRRMWLRAPLRSFKRWIGF
jgi:hypothetical protein